MQFKLPLDSHRLSQGEEEWLLAGGRRVRLRSVRNRRARRYVLRLSPDGSARLTIPRGGSPAEGKRFAERNVAWLEKQLVRQATQQNRPRDWRLGTEILFHGEPVRLEAGANGDEQVVRFANESVGVADRAGDLRPAVEQHLRGVAERELRARVLDLAAMHQLPVRRVMVRNQRSRWGSCSKRGTVSLNWRLIQAPVFVRDYLILHELAHLKEMNHSSMFWGEVARLCPDYAMAERWLKQHSSLLR